jgi:trimeric autotransporter adhesin
MNRAEESNLLQADQRKFRGSTIERKQMSTTIKRIALVAVAALSLGVVSVAPSQAAANTLLVYTAGDGAPAGDLNTGTGVAGPFNYVTVEADTWSASASNDYIITTDSTFGTAGAGTVSSDKKSIVANGLNNSIQVMTPAVGTVTVSYWKRTAGVLAATAAETVVITVNATKQSGSYSAANTTAFIVAGETNTVHSATADVAVTGLGTANTDTATASIQIFMKDALKAAYNDTITATVISGGANVRMLAVTDSTTAADGANATAGTFSANVLTTTGQAIAFVHANGTSGPAVIRLTNSAGTEIAQKTVTFSSTTVATLAATVVFGNINGTKAGAVTVIAKDAAGYVVPNAPVSVTSSDTTKIASATCANTDATGKAVCQVVATASASGASTLTFKSGVATTTASVRAAGVKATKLSVTPSVTAAEAGTKVTYTLEVADAAGALADGDYVAKFFTAAPVTSNGGTGAFATDTITVLAGKATADVFVPFIAGKYSTTWTLKGTKGGAATADLDAALVGTTITADVDVTNASADAALDAANEAATAAQDATDAAIQAADAADEATAAVAALSLEVNTLIAGLKKQLVTLTNLVKNLQKAVAAKK